MNNHEGTAVCRRCDNFIPKDACVVDTFDESTGKCVCPECRKAHEFMD